MAMTVAQHLGVAIERLKAFSDSPRADAELLLAHALGTSRSSLRMREADTPSARVAAVLDRLLVRRISGEPISYLLGTQGFWSLELEVTPEVLIPRPDTETLVEWALERIARDAPSRVLELGTGSGCIALAIASERPHAQVQATDRSEAALRVARANAERVELTHRVAFRQGDWFDALDPAREDAFDLVLSNPPYIAARDPHLDALRHEPIDALVSGEDGLDDIRRIVANAAAWLRRGEGTLMIEHGHDQGDDVRELFEATGSFEAIETRRDLGGRERVTSGRARR
ncbi:MAG: prmC [Panacagrimonas sp.]|jgi:release factor glutamine methyltransferase|nr:peptide chain release factor N(5)-glutamine methyltransferase [Panacagrimonas sp.]MCC2655453.1 prmC [Panacagrimonas sp.]